MSQEGNKSSNPAFVKQKVLASGKWLSLTEITYRDAVGRERTWESLSRTTTSSQGVDAVTILPILRRTLKYDCVICIKQYRPPMKTHTLEFPAGLIDAGEDVQTAALRELREETGYTATVKHVSPATCLDPGTEDCTMQIVTAEIDGDDAANVKPEQQPEESEFIEVLTIPVDEMLTKLNEYAEAGVVVDARVYSYAIALAQAQKVHRLEPAQK